MTTTRTQVGIIAITLLAFSGPAASQVLTVDGNLLLSWCNVNINSERPDLFQAKGGSCLGYLASILNIQMSGSAVGGRMACIPPNADMSQMTDVFRAYMRDHPEKRHLLAANLAAQAFSEAFPCRP